MCGINGIFGYSDRAPPISRDELYATRDYMRKRGPDGSGKWISQDERVGLGHRRLAILDLTETGAQPMESNDGTAVIVFNGEIYNHRELRAWLEQKGHVFSSNSDTEVLLHLYAEKRETMLHDLRGMFAFAIWDKRDQSLFLARDPFGIKPLYVADDGHTLRFASQVKALIAGNGVSAELSPEGQASYWIWGHIREPFTLHRHIRAQEPGTWQLIQQSGKRKTGAFDRVSDLLGLGDTSDPPASLAPEPLHDALLQSLRVHLNADVPVGIFLSAGIDSATLLALAAESGASVKTVTLGFEEFKGTPRDETALAEELARHYGSNHKTVWISKGDFTSSLDSFVKDMDQPSIDGLNTWFVSRAGSEAGLKVALSGLGADEFFGGYPSFRQLPQMRRLLRPFAHMPQLGRLARRASLPILSVFTNQKFAGLLEFGHNWDGAYMLRRALRMPWELSDDARVYLPKDKSHFSPSNADHVVVSYLEATRYMRDQLLRDTDWASMAHSLEIRTPFIDKVITRHVAHAACRGSPYTKADLAGSTSPSLPDAISRRTKTGFSVPVADWLRGQTPRGRGLRVWQRLIGESFNLDFKYIDVS